MKQEEKNITQTPLYKIKRRVSARIKEILKLKSFNKKYKTFEIVGCTPQELKEYLEKQFTIGMSWENHGQFGWHIDHIIPLDSGITEDEIYKLCHYTNLQPLWWEENLEKSNKIL